VSVDKKIISLHNEWYIGNVLICAHFSSKLAHGTYCLCYITQLFRLLGIFLIFSHINAQSVLWWLERHTCICSFYLSERLHLCLRCCLKCVALVWSVFVIVMFKVDIVCGTVFKRIYISRCCKKQFNVFVYLYKCDYCKD